MYRIDKKKSLSCDCPWKFPEIMKDEMFCLRFHMLPVHFFFSDDYLGRKTIQAQAFIKFQTSLVKLHDAIIT